MQRLLMCCLLLVSLAACDSDSDSDHDSDHGLTSADDACEHFEMGPNTAVTAGVAPSAAADASGEHQRVDVTLADLGDGTFGGAVTYSADEAGEFIVFLDADVALDVTDAGGQAVAAEAEETTDAACADIVRHNTYDFDVGTYTLTFEPTTSTSLRMVVVHAGDDHDHE